MDCLLSRPPPSPLILRITALFNFLHLPNTPPVPPASTWLSHSSDGRNSASGSDGVPTPFPLSPTNLKLFLSRRDGQVPVRLWP